MLNYTHRKNVCINFFVQIYEKLKNILCTVKQKNIRLFALITKEFYSVWRDKKSRSVIFLPPIMQLFLFSHAATLDITNIKIGILNEDITPVTRQLVSNIQNSKYFSKVIEFQNLNGLKNAVDDEIVRVSIYIPPDFTKKYLSKKNPDIGLILDGRHTNASQIIAGYVSQIAADFERSSTESMRNPDMSVRGAQSLVEKNQIQVDSRNWYNPNLYYHWFIISSLVGILSMATVILLAALSLAREKESGTFDEILVSPLKPHEILFGKLIIPLFFGIIDGIIILIAARLFFKIPFEGSLLLYFFALMWFLVSVVGIGLFISSLCKTQQQAMLGVFVFMFPAMILSGYSAPVENITPQILQNLTVLNPLRFFLVISKGIILKNMNFLNVSLNLVPIIIITFVTLAVANYAFKNKLE